MDQFTDRDDGSVIREGPADIETSGKRPAPADWDWNRVHQICGPPWLAEAWDDKGGQYPREATIKAVVRFA